MAKNNVMKVRKDEVWDTYFEEYWETNFHRKIKWVYDWGSWVKYIDEEDEKGYYKPIHPKDFRRLLIFWLDLGNLPYDPTKEKIARDRIEAKFGVSLSDFDADLNIWNVRNGLLNLNTLELTEHTPEYLSLNQADVEFKREPGKTPKWDLLFQYYPDMKYISWYLRCIIFNNMSDQRQLKVLGPKRAGKGTLCELMKCMFGKKTMSFVDFEDWHDPFLFAPTAGKKINMVAEITILARIYPKAVKLFKTIVGLDGDVLINPKRAKPFFHYYIPFFTIEFGNQLYKLPPTDPGSYFVRIWIAEMKNKPVKTDKKFKPALLLEKDDIFSKLVIQGYQSFNDVYKETTGKDYDEEVCTKFVSEKWDLWSEPVTVAVNELFERGGEDLNEVDCELVYDELRDWLSRHKYTIPNDTELKRKTTSALRKMNIQKKRRSNNNNIYRPLRFKTVNDELEEESDEKPSFLADLDPTELNPFNAEEYAPDFVDYLEQKGFQRFGYKEIETYQKEEEITQKDSFLIVQLCEQMDFIAKDGKDRWVILP